jgi:F-type H+-transporting ATPase subunit a
MDSIYIITIITVIIVYKITRSMKVIEMSSIGIMSISIMIYSSNIMSNIVYSKGITTQIIITILISGTIVIGNIIRLDYKYNNTTNLSIILSIIIIPIEIISYISRIISLAVRITANNISGHILINIVLH